MTKTNQKLSLIQKRREEQQQWQQQQLQQQQQQRQWRRQWGGGRRGGGGGGGGGGTQRIVCWCLGVVAMLVWRKVWLLWLRLSLAPVKLETNHKK